MAHLLDDGTAVVLERNLDDIKTALGKDGESWANLLRPFVEHWREFAAEVLGPVPLIPRHPLLILMARFGMSAFFSAKTIAGRFRGERTRALFGGQAAHSFVGLDEPLSGAFSMLMAVPAHAVGWPIRRGGSQSLTNALCSYLEKLRGKIKTSSRIETVEQLPGCETILCDVTPDQLLKIAGERLSESYKRILKRYRYGSGAFKVDYALNAPIPWKASDCRRAITVHLGGSFEEIAASEKAVRNGEYSERPFVLFAQPSLFDPSRAPAGKHTAWAYCQVPNGSQADMLPRLEDQIERFAPGFRDCVLARHLFAPTDFEGMDANLVGGDINGGAMDIRQFLLGPSWRRYGTSARDIYMCSSSTPPGGGVHGMFGYNAAKVALTRR